MFGKTHEIEQLIDEIIGDIDAILMNTRQASERADHRNVDLMGNLHETMKHGGQAEHKLVTLKVMLKGAAQGMGNATQEISNAGEALEDAEKDLKRAEENISHVQKQL